MNNVTNGKDDVLKRFVDKDTDELSEFSPMDPPDAFNPPSIKPIAVDDLAPALKHLVLEHRDIVLRLDAFELAIMSVRSEGISKETNQQLSSFFQYLDDCVVAHQLKEERIVFPILHDRLIDIGEHLPGEVRETAVDMLEHDHSKTMQLATLCFSLLGVASRLNDAVSRAVVVDAAVDQGIALVELMRLHMFREDNVVFALAQEHLTAADHERMTLLLDKYFSIAL